MSRMRHVNLMRPLRVALFVVVLLALVMPAAAASSLWVRRYDGTADDVDEGAAVAFDGLGNVYVAGRSVSAGTGCDTLVLKYAANGTLKWVARYDGPVSGEDKARAVAVDDDGNVYITGRSRGSGTWDDFVTIKYNASGAQQWVRRYSNGIYADEALDIAIDSEGNVIVTGFSAAKDSGNDYFTIQYGPGGATKWTRRYDGPAGEGDKATGVAVDSEDNVYVTGASMGEGTNWDYCTIKYDPDGAQLWVKRWDGPKHNSDGATGIAIDQYDVVYVTGYSYRAGDNADYLTICYRKGGSVRWTRRYDGPAGGPDVPWAIAIDTDSVYVTGASYGNTTGQDYATVRYLLDGTQNFAKRYSSTGKYDDVANDVAVGNDRVYVTGFSNADLFTIAYGRGGRYKWSDRYNGPGKAFDQGYAIGVCPATGNVYATGGSQGAGTKADVVTIKYAP